MKKLLNFLSEAFYPSGIKCIVCDAELSAPTRYCICGKCKLPSNDNYCVECGRPIPTQNAVCDQCKEYRLRFDGARSSFIYKDEVAKLVQRFKYNNARYLAPFMAEYMSDTFYTTDWDIDVITFVPIHKSRRRTRGYNQSELLAKELSKRINKPYEELLIKTAKTKNMAKLNRSQRQELIKKSFGTVNSEDIKGKNVLIVDDVLTTGATSCECSDVLFNSGAKQVFVLTFASVAAKTPLAENNSIKRKAIIKKLKDKNLA